MKTRRPIFSSIRTFLLLVALLIGTLPNAASAVGVYDESFYQGNDILYYTPNSSSGCAGSSGGTTPTTNLDIPGLTGNDNTEKVWNYLTSSSVGLSPEQAAGIMGNIYEESGFNPDLEENTTRAEKGYGIVQWTFGRRTALEDAAKAQNVEVSDLGFQLAFMVQESQSRTIDSWVLARAAGNDYGKVGDNEWEVLKRQKTTESAAHFWHASFERSADTVSQIQERIDAANKFLQQFSGSAGGSSTSGGSNCSSSFSGGNLIETLLAYAHPKYYPNNYSGPVPPPKPAYVEAATKAQSEGKWVGGGNIEGDSNQAGYPAIDCGGFVSLLLINSGFEPEYNYGLDMSKGASNQQYGQLPWAKENWSFIGNGGDINVSDLRPGDVAFSDGHTFVFVGQVDGFESQYASASYSWWRAPMAGGMWNGGGESVTNPEYVWYGRR
jgi:hypothetical protein